MIVDKLREVQLVAESKLVKIDPTEQIFSRYDKTVYIREPIDHIYTVTGTAPAYVEAGKFFALLPETKTIDLQKDFCLLTLKNGAEYKLPLYDIAWDDKQVDVSSAYSVTIKLAAGRLSSATLKNLANPALQCIYIDSATAVSCNSMVACIDGTVTSATPLILPPDIISIIEGAETTLYIVDKNYVIKLGDGVIYVPIPEIDYAEMADVLRSSLPEQIDRYPITGLFESLKRLSTSHDYISFTKDTIVSDQDFEPFNFPAALPEYQYNIQSLLSVIPQVKHIAQSKYALLLYGDKFLFMVSPEEAEQSEEVQEGEVVDDE